MRRPRSHAVADPGRCSISKLCGHSASHAPTHAYVNGGVQVRSSLAGQPLLSTQQGNPRPEGRAGTTHQDGSAALVSVFGVGPDTAATLLIAAGSNPERLHSEAAFASLCGVSPIPASSGKTNRHRLNRGGDRQANAALYRIVVVRLRQDCRTKAYMRRRTGEGMNKTEVIHCLKRQVAREVFSALQHSAGIIGSAA